jgi:hypothetical protein
MEISSDRESKLFPDFENLAVRFGRLFLRLAVGNPASSAFGLSSLLPHDELFSYQQHSPAESPTRYGCYIHNHQDPSV